MFLQDNWFKNGKQDTLANNKINLAYLWATETVQKSAPLVRIGLTDLPKTGGGATQASLGIGHRYLLIIASDLKKQNKKTKPVLWIENWNYNITNMYV